MYNSHLKNKKNSIFRGILAFGGFVHEGVYETRIGKFFSHKLGLVSLSPINL